MSLFGYKPTGSQMMSILLDSSPIRAKKLWKCWLCPTQFHKVAFWHFTCDWAVNIFRIRTHLWQWFGPITFASHCIVCRKFNHKPACVNEYYKQTENILRNGWLALSNHCFRLIVHTQGATSTQYRDKIRWLVNFNRFNI